MQCTDNGQLLVERQIAETQGELFRYVKDQGYDIIDYIYKYMNSDFCRREMDSDYSYFHGKPDTVVFSYLEKEITPKNNAGNETLSDPYWIGCVYRYISLLSGISSKELIKIISPETLDDYSVSCEEMEMREAAQAIIGKESLRL